MRVCVHGLWHLGAVTAACLASAGHQVVALDENASAVAALNGGTPPLYEPGLAELLEAGLESNRLIFTTDASAALADCEVYWVTFDTPVDENDVPDVNFVLDRVKQSLPILAPGCVVLVSSQLPVGSTRALARYAELSGFGTLTFGYLPENLRLGKAIEVFTKPDRVVVGVSSPSDEEKVRALLRPFTDSLLFMSIESAEMTKHAINAFFATSVAFANEIGVLCEHVGANASEVTRGLRSEARIGPSAYVAPGLPFSGGTLARDVEILNNLTAQLRLDLPLLPAVRASNEHHRDWAMRRLADTLDGITGRTIAILGLTYKPGTDTLRRSSALELARKLVGVGASVRAFDPKIKSLPNCPSITLARSVQDAVAGAEAAVIATEWPQFKSEDWDAIASSMANPVIVDPGGFVADRLSGNREVTYLAVGRMLRPQNRRIGTS